MKRLFGLLIVVAVVLVCLLGQAAEIKIGYVDFEKAFNEYNRTKTEDARLKKELESAEADLEKKAFEISKLRDQLELLGEEARKEKEEDLRKRIQDLNKQRTDMRKELVEARNEKWLEIYDEIKKITAEYGKNNGYTYIFDDKALIYKVDDGDITAEIIKILNKEEKK